MKLFKRLIRAIAEPFKLYAALLDESRRINEGGKWDKWHEKNNRKRGE